VKSVGGRWQHGENSESIRIRHLSEVLTFLRFFFFHKILTDRPVGLSVLYLVFVLHKKRTKRKRTKPKAGMSGKMKENGGIMDSGLLLFRRPAYVSSQRNKINIEINIHHLVRKGTRPRDTLQSGRAGLFENTRNGALELMRIPSS